MNGNRITFGRFRLEGDDLRPVGGWDKVVVVFAAYFVASILTLPFVGSLWVGEVPLLAILQLPKILLAEWLRTDVVMEMIKILGLSAGSFSPDYLLARPYALAIAYLIPLAAIAGIVRWRSQKDHPLRPAFVRIFFVAAIIDFGLTLLLGASRTLTLY